MGLRLLRAATAELPADAAVALEACSSGSIFLAFDDDLETDDSITPAVDLENPDRYGVMQALCAPLRTRGRVVTRASETGCPRRSGRISGPETPQWALGKIGIRIKLCMEYDNQRIEGKLIAGAVLRRTRLVASTSLWPLSERAALATRSHHTTKLETKGHEITPMDGTMSRFIRNASCKYFVIS